MKSKRPWKKYARIKRIELNNGDVKFRTEDAVLGNRFVPQSPDFEALMDAESHLDAWWTEWWHKQVKRTRRA